VLPRNLRKTAAKSSFDVVATGLTRSSAKIILLDRVLAQYGPETMEARDLLRRSIASAIELIWPERNTGKLELRTFEAETGAESVQGKLRELAPRSDSQRLLLPQALQISGELAQAHWLLIEETQNSLPTPFLLALHPLRQLWPVRPP
jgi:hypothetical protein